MTSTSVDGAADVDPVLRPVQVGEGRGRVLLLTYLLPAVVVVLFLLIWQLVPRWLGVPDYVFPNLSDTLLGLQQNWSDIGIGLMITLQDALVGFILGNGLAVLGATAFAYSSNTERAFYPLAIIVQTIPIVVYVPLLRLVFFQAPVVSSNPDALAVVAVTVLITFFPTLVNMTAGFKAVDPRVLELMRLLNASRTQIFLKVRFPSALPYLFSSLKITSTLAFVGAVVGEWMSNSGINPLGALLSGAGITSLLGFPTNPANAAGIGYTLVVFQYRINKPGIFAAVVAISLLSILFFGAMSLLERVAIPWEKRG